MRSLLMLSAFSTSLCSAVAARAERSGASLQERIDAAKPGATVVVDPGSYEGALVIDKPLRLIGVGRPTLLGTGDGSVVEIRAPDVVIQGFEIDGRRRGDLGKDSSGVHVTGRHATVRDCRIHDTIFGVYLREAHDTTVDGCSIHGIPGLAPGEKGSGIHVWNTTGFSLLRNEIREVRDGFYIQSSTGGRILGNEARDLRYGIHYMYSDENVFEDNLFAGADAGTALMYSRRIVFRRNRFVHNRGFASVGLLFKACDDVVAEDNLIADNARGIFIEGSYRNTFRRNVVADSDTAIVLYDSAGNTRFEGNSFVANLTPLTLVGRRTDTVFEGNYWSDNGELDLDGDGRSDRPYRLTNVFDHLRGNLTAADLFAQSLAAPAVAAAERAFPVLEDIPVVDPRPLVRPPDLRAVPVATSSKRGPAAAGLLACLGLIVGAAVTLGRAGRRRQP
jgi:nitrous oxidase accessory protein